MRTASKKSIAKRGFATRREAELYKAQIKLELQTGSAAMVGYGPESKQKLREYLPKWYESYRHNLAKSTQYSYGSDINLYLIPMLGEVPLNKLTPKMIDDMIAQLREKQLAENSVRYCQRILSSSLSIPCPMWTARNMSSAAASMPSFGRHQTSCAESTACR